MTPKKIELEKVDAFAEALEKGAAAAKDGVDWQDLDEAMGVMTSAKGFIEEMGKDKVTALEQLVSKLTAILVAERQAQATE